MVSSIAPLRYARTRPRPPVRGPHRDAVEPAPARCCAAYAAVRAPRAGPSAGAGNRRARLADAHAPAAPAPAQKPRSTTPRWWPPWRRSARSQSPRRWRWRCRRTHADAGSGLEEDALHIAADRARSVWAARACWSPRTSLTSRRRRCSEPHPRRTSIQEPWNASRCSVRRAAGDPPPSTSRVETQNASRANADERRDADAADARAEPRSKQERSWRARIRWARVKLVRPSSPGFAYQPPPPRRESPRTPWRDPGGLASPRLPRVVTAARAKKRVTKKKKRLRFDDEAPGKTPFRTNGNETVQNADKPFRTWPFRKASSARVWSLALARRYSERPTPASRPIFPTGTGDAHTPNGRGRARRVRRVIHREEEARRRCNRRANRRAARRRSVARGDGAPTRASSLR